MLCRSLIQCSGDLVADGPGIVGTNGGDLCDLFLVLDHLSLFLNLDDSIGDGLVDTSVLTWTN